jgi:hypothetical protein
MTTSLAQIAGEPARQATQGGDEADPGVVAARAAADLPAGFVRGAATSAYHFATERRTLKSSARWYSNLMQAHHNTRGPA